MKKSLFREKSIERISSPDDLGEYLRVTKPSVFVLLLAIFLCVGGIYIWSSLISITSFCYGTGVATGRVLTATFEDRNTSKYLNDSLVIEIGEYKIPIETIGMDEKGNIIAVCTTDMPPGEYNVKVGYKQTKIISMLFN